MLTNYSHRKPIYGFGINDADYFVATQGPTRNSSVLCPYYKRWHNIMYRVFNNKNTGPCASYIDTTVNESFKYFMDFRRWAEKQGFCPENRHLIDLDKDILFSGNNEYSSDKCAFVIQRVNKIISTSYGTRGELPIGVRFEARSNKYTAKLQINGKSKYLGTYLTEEQAHKAWQLAKADYMEDSIANYEQESESIGLVYRPDVVEAILKRSTLLRDAAESGKIINSL